MGIEQESTAVDLGEVEALYREHWRFVWHSLRRMGVPEHATEDAVQDVFVVVHQRLADFEGRSSVRTWIYGIAYRVAAEHRRKDARAQRREIPSHGSSPRPADEDVETRRRAALLEELLGELDLDKRTAFVLLEVEGLRAKEVAARLELPVNTVYSRLRLARRALEKALARRLKPAGLPQESPA